MLSLEAVEKIVHTHQGRHLALKNIHLEVEPGEIYGILGKKGAGKTTLLRCVHCLESIDTGSIMLDNSPLTHLPEKTQILARRAQGMVFAEPLLLSSRTVYQNVELALENMGDKKKDRQEKVVEALQMTGLQDKALCYPKELTLGQQYRVSFARALVNQPNIVLCDDITKNCDARTTHGLLKLFRELNERYHFTIVLATDAMEVIKMVCHRVAILHQGEMVEHGEVSGIFAHPKTDIAKEYVKSATRLEMPNALRRRLKSQETDHTYPVLRLIVDNNAGQEPFIAHAVQQFELTMNILQAHLEAIRDLHLGIMIAELRGKKNNIQSAIAYLEERGLHIEVLGYVL